MLAWLCTVVVIKELEHHPVIDHPAGVEMEMSVGNLQHPPASFMETRDDVLVSLSAIDATLLGPYCRTYGTSSAAG